VKNPTPFTSGSSAGIAQLTKASATANKNIFFIVLFIKY
jgi:hypothetical protein